MNVDQDPLACLQTARQKSCKLTAPDKLERMDYRERVLDAALLAALRRTGAV